MSLEARELMMNEAMIELFEGMRGLSFWEATVKLFDEEGCEVCETLMEMKTDLHPSIWALDIAEVVARFRRAAEGCGDA
jgi:hypothetical protein